ncbi:MAG: DUF418 domain-containing protein [Phycisphaerales bacterium]|nr:MAG: DUF418 domain-containing protein [Phycisphaerales bacterium]
MVALRNRVAAVPGQLPRTDPRPSERLEHERFRVHRARVDAADLAGRHSFGVYANAVTDRVAPHRLPAARHGLRRGAWCPRVPGLPPTAAGLAVGGRATVTEPLFEVSAPVVTGPSILGASRGATIGRFVTFVRYDRPMEHAPSGTPAIHRPVETGPFDAGGGPHPPKERIVVVDAVRGLALFGILVVNAPLYFWPVQTLALGGIPAAGFVEDAANALVRFAFEGKFFTIFSLLFGVGVALQLSRGHRPRIVVRRLLLLALFGAVHISLFWWGDILLHYAILGFALVLTRHWTARRLVRAAFVLLAVPVVLQLGFVGLGSLAATSPEGASAFAEVTAESNAAMAAQEQQALSVYPGRDLVAAAARRWGDWGFATFGTLFSGMLPVVVAMFFLGAAAVRSGWLEAAAVDRWRWLLTWTLPAAIVANAVFAWGALSGAQYEFGTWSAALASIAFVVGAPSGALTIAAGAALALRGGGPVATALAAVGRLALTTYLAQSLVMTTLAYGYGFGLYGTVTHAQALGLAVALFAIQVPLAVLYARRFRFGPAEWLWRAGTYGRRPRRGLA